MQVCWVPLEEDAVWQKRPSLRWNGPPIGREARLRLDASHRNGNAVNGSQPRVVADVDL